MKKIVFLTFLFACAALFGQGNIHRAGEGGVFTQDRLAALKTGEGALGNNPHLMNLYSDMRNKFATLGAEVKLGLEDIEGSIYLDDEYKLGTLYYEGEAFKKSWLRYDAYNDEFELKDVDGDQAVQALVKYPKLSCSLSGDQFVYTSFKDKEEVAHEGYLIVLCDGDQYRLFERRQKIFKEGKPAKTSLGTSFPHRFLEDRRYYVATSDGMPRPFKLKKSQLSEIFGPQRAGKIQDFIKENKIDMDDREDLKALFTFANAMQ